jgi:hypothetical protein
VIYTEGFSAHRITAVSPAESCFLDSAEEGYVTGRSGGLVSSPQNARVPNGMGSQNEIKSFQEDCIELGEKESYQGHSFYIP